MRAAQMKERPGFSLMKQTDIQSLFYMKLPRWLFFDPRYADLSLEAKLTYTFLLNRFQLSRRKGWVNEHGEVFVIYPRLTLARELRICEQRVTAAFRQLVERQLVWEKRCGRGEANQIYLAQVQPQEDPNYSCAPFLSPEEDSALEGAVAEPQDLPFQKHGICGSRTADLEVPDPQNLRPSKKEQRKKEQSQAPVCPSVPPETDDERELSEILANCELDSLDPALAQVFENAIERLFYSDSYRIGNATLPQKRVRSRLHLLTPVILCDVANKLAANLDQPVKNSTAYVMATLFNYISECHSDLMVDPYLNRLRAPPNRR